MPGVPEGSIKINKHSDVNCVTFYGRAPVLWPNLECSDRVYAGFIAINTDPANINLQYSIVNGCFRIVIPNCDGTLHHVGHRQNVLGHPHHHPHHDPDKPGQCRSWHFMGPRQTRKNTPSKGLMYLEKQ